MRLFVAGGDTDPWEGREGERERASFAQLGGLYLVFAK